VSKNKQHISSILTKAFALVLYISFLGVQLFFNFDTGKGPATTIRSYSYTTQQSNSPLGIKQNNKKNGNHATILLNKRFQPESILVMNTISIQTPVCYIGTTIKYLPFDQYIPTSNKLVHSLRGPPVVA
jgi:hypothetical protein